MSLQAQRTAPAPQQRSGPNAGSRWGAFVRFAGRPLAFYAASRVLVLLAAYAATLFNTRWTVLSYLGTWDGMWYRSVMTDGYPSVVPEVGGQATYVNLVFFPVFPLVARAVAWVLPGSDAAAMLVTTFIFGAVAVVLVALLARWLTDEQTAIRATALFCFFPGSLVLSMAYAEAVAIVLAVACLWALLRHRWFLAGVAAALATATRPNALVLVVACAWQAGIAIKERREWRALIAPVLAPVGVLAFFGFLWLRTGEAGVWFRVEREAWQTQAGGGMGFEFFLDFLRAPLIHPGVTVLGLSFIFATVATWILVKRGWPGVLTVYTMAILLMSAFSRNDFIRPRDILTAVPLFIALGKVTRGRVLFATVGVFAAGLAYVTVLHALPFGGPP